ncbi:MAG: UDP-N-acetylmuramoyl-tripeptide--D-alanyl-D-alanine ligase [Bacteroidales bacterium]|nr:UDP-N-acetylmuramoyl-tripeptide--D-alanyl-D-alanine ligase [Bacteroidales bacterium]
MNIEQLYQTYLQSRAVTTDSRQITPGCIFFAFKGETFDGNAFAPQALEQGAAMCVISDPQYKVDDRCVVVGDVLATLQQLARYHRAQLTIPILGITGTNGKTTTKELVHAVLSRRYRTHATMGNFNNHLGVPLTLLSIPANAEVAIIEMGANHPGEIEALCHIADPDFGLITNVGRAHLEGFGGFEGVVRTKTELYRHLAAKQGTAFVNADNAILTAQAAQCHLLTITYGASEVAQVRGHLVGSEPYMKYYVEDGDNVYNIQSNLLGNYNFDNAMAATAVGRYFHVDLWDIKEAIEQYAPSNRRSQYKETAHNTLFLDCYNANPSSMKVALDNLEALSMPNKVAILGGMRELGGESLNEHRTIADRLNAHPDIQAILVGPEFGFVCGNPAYGSMQWFPSVEEAKQHLLNHPLTQKTILLKGSNGTRMWLLEEVL